MTELFWGDSGLFHGLAFDSPLLCYHYFKFDSDIFFMCLVCLNHLVLTKMVAICNPHCSFLCIIWKIFLNKQFVYLLLIINLYIPAATNDLVPLFIPLHTGSDVLYSWDFGDGNITVTLNRSLEYAWDTAGIYNVTVYAENEINSKTAFVNDLFCIYSF